MKNNIKSLINIFIIISAFVATSCKKVAPIENTNISSDSVEFQDTFVYDSNSKYKSVLNSCVLSLDKDISCSLETLPLLRDEGAVTKETIKARLVVSHKWMGDRFLEMLDYLDDDIKTLLGATTAIVIDDDINPAFYTTQTGAIYLDARYLWLTPSEANDITIKEDFRSNYGDDLNFIPAWRYVKNSEVAIKYWDISNPVDRTVDDIKINLARLLYHELSHANDFANKNIIDNSDKRLPIAQILENNQQYRLSNSLYQNYPLTEQTLMHLGKVLYFGESATLDDKSLIPQDVGSLFQSDNATNMYAYANQYEDFAMLFESAMMKYHYNIDMDIAFVSKPSNATNCDDYIVGWGVRNRIAKEEIKPRVEIILKNLLPTKDWNDFLTNKIGSKQSLNSNVGWCNSISINGDIQARLIDKNMPIPINDFKAPY